MTNGQTRNTKGRGLETDGAKLSLSFHPMAGYWGESMEVGTTALRLYFWRGLNKKADMLGGQKMAGLPDLFILSV